MAILNWDQLDFLTRNGSYNTFVTNAMVQTQYFALGINRVSVNFPFGSGMSTAGENGTNTAEAGSYGAGDDVELSGNGVIRFQFDQPVNDLRFSLYDLDNNQSVKVTAQDAAGTAINLMVYMTAVQSGVLSISGSGTTSAIAQANGTACANNNRSASLNISIPGNQPSTANGIKTVQIELGVNGGAGGNFWLSDLGACVAGSFPLNYYLSEKPYTGQPAYYLVTPDNNSVYLFNPKTGKADWLFSEPSSPWINSLAYDPIHKIAYYVSDNSSPKSVNRSLKKYDFNTESLGIALTDLGTLGIPIYDISIESAGAAFYNGSLFLGIEGTNNNRNSGRESSIWRIDFDAGQVPYRASQVLSLPADDGNGTLTHDWGDFTIKDGILYDFNSGNGSSTSQFVHFNMQDGTSQIFAPWGNPLPVQAGQTWDGNLYWTGGQGSEGGKVARYLENGSIGSKTSVSVTACSPGWLGKAGDASDPFRPKVDFGDAPASYDPDRENRACHEYDCNLRLGASFDREWNKIPSVMADGDGPDEDGILNTMILSNGLTSFVQDVKIYNHTGINATLGAWLDFNMNGIFDPSEGMMLTIPSQPFLQTITLAFPMVNISLSPGSSIYLRLRLTSANNGMSAANATGWMPNGEVEDYPILVESVLPVQFENFSAQRQNGMTWLDWSVVDGKNIRQYMVERSMNGRDWNPIANLPAAVNGAGREKIHYEDSTGAAGSYYRIKIRTENQYIQSAVLRTAEGSVKGDSFNAAVSKDELNATYQSNSNEPALLYVLDMQGKEICRKKWSLKKGVNHFHENLPFSLSSGYYVVIIETKGWQKPVRISLF